MTQEVKILSIVGAVTVVILAGAVFLLSGTTTKPSSPNSKADPKILVRDDSNKTGSPSAKITFVEFGDYQCPSCGAAYPVVKEIIGIYGDKLRFVFRNFPLPMHPNALPAAEAAEAAGAQGKYWQMYSLLFENQNQWASLSNPTDKFVEYAKQLGLDTDKFRKDVEGSKFANKIQADINDGAGLGVNSTPTFYINGEQMVGVSSFSNLKSKIDTLLR